MLDRSVFVKGGSASEALVRLTVLVLALSGCTEAAGGPLFDPDGGNVDCEPGMLGCECASGDVCATDLRGNALVCNGAVCVPADCEPGDTGCVCLGGTTCGAAGDVCRDGICKPTGCTAGMLHCDCLAGTCNAGLHCDESLGGGTCVDGSGFPGGACLANRLCYGQHRCDADLDVCVPCEAGSQACIPREGGACNAGLVSYAGRCLGRRDVPPPESERTCRTRCREDLVVGGVHRPCVEGFLEGCVGSLECVDGSCVVPGNDPVSCATDNDCPDFQRCFANGRCYSECDANTDCLDGYACYRHACRAPCETANVASVPCPSGMHCDTRDGVAGVCMPLPEAGEEGLATSAVRATFRVTPEIVGLSNLARRASVTLEVDGPVAERFEIVKRSQRVLDASGNELVDPLAEANPLRFVSITAAGATTTSAGTLEVTVPPRCGDACPVLRIEVTGAPSANGWARWEGELEVRHPSLGDRLVRLAYQAAPDGRWTGRMYYFASFPDENLEQWRSGDPDVDVDDVGNGLIQLWGTYRARRLSGGFAALEAALTATKSQSWQWDSVRSACEATHKPPGAAEYEGACYLFDDGLLGSAPREYVSNLGDAPIPTGATEYPIALNLRTVGSAGSTELEGIIDSSVALHYPGNPFVTVAFATSPFSTQGCATGGDCVAFLSAFDATTRVGGRASPDGEECPSEFVSESYPWLLPDFLSDSDAVKATRTECRDRRAPFASGSWENANLARANPFRDGTATLRQLSLVDGALVNQRKLFVLFEERFTSSVDPEGFSAFGYMLLEQANPILDDAALDAAIDEAARADVETPDPDTGGVGPTCDPEWLRELLGDDFDLVHREDARTVVNVMLTGVPTGDADSVETWPSENVHALCVDTQLIDGGGDPLAPVPCPPVSRVRYFVLPDDLNDAIDIAALDCQRDPTPAGSTNDDRVRNGTCGAQLDAWIASVNGIIADPLWRCEDPHAVYCADDPLDPAAGKVFYYSDDAVLAPLEPTIQEAFRYKTRFRTDTNRQVGFAPAMCAGSGSFTPYCYDPIAIEESLARVDCLLYVYDRFAAAEHEHPDWTPLRTFLSSSLSRYPENSTAPLVDGFERLYAELLIMLGDEAYADALSSRFDLEATQSASFLGSRFEERGIDLEGVAGFELRSLYQAAQYYELANERLFDRVLPVVLVAIDEQDIGTGSVASQGFVVEYLERLIGGSTKAAITWSDVAVRYQRLNRADLAEAVLSRAYAATYLQSVVMSQLMLGVADSLGASQRDDIVRAIESAQVRYQVALDQMREVFTTVRDNVDVFGFPPDYVPFPVLDDNDSRYSNAFEAALGLARPRMETARRFEDDAITTSREFETDAASFQSELVQIARSYEDRLHSLCGAFQGHDGDVYPAIAKYAALSDATASMGDPCGRTGTGEIHEQLAEVQIAADASGILMGRANNVLAAIADENAAHQDRCGASGAITLYNAAWETHDNQKIYLQDSINRMQAAVSGLDRTFNVASSAAMASTPWGAAGVFAAGAYIGTAIGLEAAIADKQHEILQIEHDMRLAELGQQCLLLDIDRKYRVKELLREVTQIELEALQLMHRAQLLVSQLDRLYLEAQRIEQRQAEAEALAIRVQAARNDPNIRVFRNTAIINADSSFDRALEHAYRATRVFEYFTSQTYAGRQDLYEIRMVSHGRYNLVTYLDELEDAYEEFRTTYRNRARRVRRISLLEDVVRAPYQDGAHELAGRERAEVLRDYLLDPARIDENGHRVVEFRTHESQTAPCTFNHQIDYIEVDFVGQNLGDEFANVLLWQEGTGVIRSLDDGSVFYRLPPALIVAQPHFNNSQRFDPSIYRRYELRERPFVNTAWKLIFDQHDDPDNQDVSIDGLTDIHIYVHYTDFTDPSSCR